MSRVSQNVVIEFCFADLVRRDVNVFVATGGTASVVKAKPLIPRSIPIVFAMGGDPVKLGIVASLSRPGDNITGVSFSTERDRDRVLLGRGRHGSRSQIRGRIGCSGA